MTQFESLTVESSVHAARGLVLIRLGGASDGFRSAYRTPGQYCVVRLAEHEAYFAIASPPGSDGFEFLVRTDGPFGQSLAALESGQTVDVGQPAGAGFPVELAEGRDAWLIGTGSGIAPLRPLLASLVGRARSLHLLYGSRQLEDVPLRDELERWAATGVDVHVILSRDDAGLRRVGGYVQDALRELVPSLKDAVLFVCGMRPMVDGIRAVAGELGLDPDRVLTNF